ncbi:hypothetical protein AAFF_G00359440 [Aldrovandia affinis]|uniref:Uncharacterized protein n=1 Tax=Aldrovandia affinis TaxID=143900 RepID=A0AAD7SI82_9TELE|nr:hypothetical protein AAFF_G00359440 [Aldrovandia affinis]
MQTPQSPLSAAHRVWNNKERSRKASEQTRFSSFVSLSVAGETAQRHVAPRFRDGQDARLTRALDARLWRGISGFDTADSAGWM